ncbi:MAG: A24 family peptidase [Lachnospiraceae bacterium]|nr:A24 family peptidase [Lachnospiraceae bacterium]
MSNIVSLFLFLSIVSLYDYRTHKIPNTHNLIAAVAGLIFCYERQGMSYVTASMIRAALVIMILLPLFIVKSLGAGDVKLISVIAIYLSLEKVFQIFILGIFLSLLPLTQMIIAKKNMKNTRIPMAPCFMVAALLVCLKEVI